MNATPTGTVPRWLSWLRQYRHLVVLTAVVTLVVWLPRIQSGGASHSVNTGNNTNALGSSTVGSGGSESTAAGGTTATAAGPGGSSGTAAGLAGGGSSGGASGPAARGPGTSGTSTNPVSGNNTTAAHVSYPGVDSAAALANPLCNPAIERMRVPSGYAAPCVVPWPAGANNGGSTYQGVTKNSIELVIYFPSGSTSAPPTPAQKQQYENDMITSIRMFTDHYELWGRKLHVDFFTGSGTSETSQNADAIQVLDQYHPFAVTTIGTIGGTGLPTFDTTIAAHGVIDWAANVSYSAAQAQAGYRWAYNPDDRLWALELGQFIGKELAGHPAIWAGDSLFHTQTRKFGLIYDDEFSDQVGLLKQTLTQYGGQLADEVSYNSSDDAATLAQEAETQIVRFKSEGINNIIAFTEPTYTTLLTDDASSQAYQPEWTVTGWAEQDTTIEASLYNQSEWAHAFGMGPPPPLQQPTTNTEYDSMYRWQTGSNPPGTLDTAVVAIYYLFTKDFALGLQDAGPGLTPVTFRNALFTAPPTGGRWCLPAPGCLTHEGMSFGTNLAGYPGDKYVDNSDFALKWWNANQSGTDEVGAASTGVWEILYGGERFSPGTFPSGQPPMFNPADALASYTTLPKADTPPSYPPPNPNEPSSVTTG
jgi:hypothetical protein